MKYLFPLLFCCCISPIFAATEPNLAQANSFLSQAKNTAFEQNKGQVTGADAKKVQFVYKSGGMSVFLLKTGIAYQCSKTHYPECYQPLDKFAKPEEREKDERLRQKIRTETYRMDVQLLGANPNANITTEGESADYVNYYNHDALNVRSYTKVIYHDIYPNIDWVIYQKGATMKYDFIVHAGGKVSDIRLQTKDVEQLTLEADGSLKMANRMGSVTEQTPVSFQNGATVATQFNLKSNLVTFDVANYDLSADLVIDPAIIWATYYGGNNEDFGYGCSTDAQGNVYLAGRTTSATNIASGGHQNTFGGDTDAFLVKFNTSGVRQWATYYGGIGSDFAFSCSIDAAGNIYMAGSSDSPTGIAFGGFQNTYGGNTDAYLVKFDALGIRQWATYYGGLGGEDAKSCVLDNQGNIYLSGLTGTGSSSAIASGGFQNTSGGSIDAYLVKFNSSGVRQWGTYYGGSEYDAASSCALDNQGNIYLSGTTVSTSGIAAGGHQNTYGGGNLDAFLVKFNTSGVRQWATYYGGTADDRSLSCAVDNQGNVYVSGNTTSIAGIASGGHQNNNSGGFDAFLVKFNGSGVRQWGTYYGGSLDDAARGCSVDAIGNVYIVGETASNTNIIASSGFQNTYGGGTFDGFLVRFNSSGVRQWGSYFGGNNGDVPFACTIDPFSNLYFVGYTSSSNNIASNGFQNTYGGGTFDAFLVKITTPITATTETENQLPTLKIYPNPTRETITLSIGNSENTNLQRIRICDVLGKIIVQISLNATEQTFDISNWAAGTYFLTTETTDGRRGTQSFLKQ
jgi:Secretion system C-terminal sorting domain/Beta-propeller repeat